MHYYQHISHAAKIICYWYQVVANNQSNEAQSKTSKPTESLHKPSELNWINIELSDTVSLNNSDLVQGH
jgi:hypothetical protein